MSREGVMSEPVQKMMPYAAIAAAIPAKRAWIGAISTDWRSDRRVLKPGYERSIHLGNRAGPVFRRAGFGDLSGLGAGAVRACRDTWLRLRPAACHRADVSRPPAARHQGPAGRMGRAAW